MRYAARSVARESVASGYSDDGVMALLLMAAAIIVIASDTRNAERPRDLRMELLLLRVPVTNSPSSAICRMIL